MNLSIVLQIFLRCPTFISFIIATLGSILDSQLSWESGKLQLARWSHRVVLFLVRTDPTRPTTRRVSLKSPISQLLLIRWSSNIDGSVSYHVCPLIMSVPNNYVCPHQLCLSPPIMSVPSPHLLCLSPPIMSVPTYYVCPHQLCLSPPIMSVPNTAGLKAT